MLLSIDPGVNHCGVAVSSFDGSGMRVHHCDCINNTRKFTPEQKDIESRYETRAAKVWMVHEHVTALLDAYSAIDHVTVEAPFYNPRTPAAYGSLLEVISALKYHVVIPRGLRFSYTEPLLVKRMFIGEKVTREMTRKEVMLRFLHTRLEQGNIVYPGLAQRDKPLTEHEVDAIAVGYAQAVATVQKSQGV